MKRELPPSCEKLSINLTQKILYMRSYPHYDWNRFWVPRRQSCNLSISGYLIDPDSEQGKYLNSDIVAYKEIEDTPCLVLLGEPGIGKTQAIKDVVGRKKKEGDRFLFVDLADYCDQGLLHRDIFKCDEFSSWRSSCDMLGLYLDSLDECMVHVQTVARMLASELANCPTERLRLRIACRTAEWPALLEEELPRIWKEEKEEGPRTPEHKNYEVYELAPLRRCDVVEAVRQKGGDPDAFLDAVAEQDVSSLAIKPITLEFLLGAFQSNKTLMRSPAQLYEEGCLDLCRDPSRSRAASRAMGDLTAQERLSVAEQIAAVTMFGKHSSVYLGHRRGESLEGEVRVSDLAVGTMSAGTGRRAVTEDDVRETLGTALFSGRGPGRMGWAHRSYAEFLAARYATTRGLTTDQMADLVFLPDADGLPFVVPQLQETVAWMGAMNQELVDRIARRDARVLLRPPLRSADSGTKARIVDGLLQSFDRLEKSDMDLDMRKRYDSLDHPGLAEQLRPYILDCGRNVLVRRVAMTIARECETTEIVDDLLSVALDSTEKPQLRVKAAYAVAQVGDGRTVTNLRPLLRCNVDEDPDDELRACALEALWPDHLSAEELFDAIAPPRNDSLIGAYHGFLTSGLLQHLKTDDLPVALNWVSQQERDISCTVATGELIQEILRRAWQNLDRSDVLDSFVHAAFARISNHDPILGGRGAKETDKILADASAKRRLLLGALVPRLPAEDIEPHRLCFSPNWLARPEDMKWLIDRLKETSDPKTKKTWAGLIRSVFKPALAKHIDLVLSELPHDPVLAEEFDGWFDPVELGSDQALDMRTRYAQALTRQAEMEEQKKPPSPSVQEVAREKLDQFDAADTDPWWHLNLKLGCDPATGKESPGSWREPDLTSLPGWEVLRDREKERCLPVAEQYLHQGQPHTEEWLGSNTFHHSAFAGYRALRLLLKFRRETIKELPESIWSKWAPCVLAFARYCEPDDRAKEVLITRAYANAPEEIISTLITLIEKGDAAHGRAYIVREVSPCWDARLSDRVLDMLRTHDSLKPGTVSDLLEELLRHEKDEAVRFALCLIKAGYRGGSGHEKALGAAEALLVVRPSDCWTALWPILRDNREFGREVFLRLAGNPDERRQGALPTGLKPDSLCELYMWLCEQFPPEEDPDYEGQIDARTSLAEFRQSLLTSLKERGTKEAVEALRRIADSQPQRWWLSLLVDHAKSRGVERVWKGVSVSELLHLADTTEGRLVNSEAQLIDVLDESLRHLEKSLHGTPPAVRDLWNTDSTTPKTENELSDYLQRHFQRDLENRGVVTNREVNIRPTDIPDFCVDAVTEDARTGDYGGISAYVEVKGCWHPDLETAMEDQLKDRYLHESPCRHGLYVVGWFRCSKWSGDDHRLSQTPDWSVKQARNFFDDQADQLSDHDTTVKAVVLDLSLR